MSLKKNDEIKLNIESVTSEGSALGRYNGLAVFVFGAVPGDVVEAHIIKVSKNYAVGIIKKIIEKSPFRIESDCPVSDKCGGCTFRSMTYEKELQSKLDFVNGNMERIAKLPIRCEEIIGASDILRYRNKAQYPVCIQGMVFVRAFTHIKATESCRRRIACFSLRNLRRVLRHLKNGRLRRMFLRLTKKAAGDFCGIFIFARPLQRERLWRAPL